MTSTSRQTQLLTFSRALRKNQTPAEAKLWMYLRGNRFAGYKFKRQVVIGDYIVDFSCFEKRLVIEVDGGHHLDQGESDNLRTEFLVGQGYQVIRFWNRQVIDEIDSVLAVIYDVLESFEK